MAKSGIHIKPGNKGKLHKDLGVPKGKPIPAAKLAKAKSSSDPAVRKRATFAENAKHFHHGSPGTVSSIDAHEDGQNATINIRHGKRKRSEHSGQLEGYHRRSSSVVVPKAHAQQYTIGQKVHAGLSSAESAPEGSDDATFAPKKKPAFGGKKGAKKKGKKRSAPPAPSRIAQAMAPAPAPY